jgi:uroporphyrinogen decarboxylase
MEMSSKERVKKVLNHEIPDRVPLFTFSVDPKFIKGIGEGDAFKAFASFGLDVYPMRSQNWCQGKPLLSSLVEEVSPEKMLSGGVYGGWEGIDEFGRIWKQGSYIGGMVKSDDDIEKYVPPLRLEERTPPKIVKALLDKYPDKPFSLNSHTGPFGLTIESMGFENFFLTFMDNRPLIKRILEARTDWFIGIAKYGAELGADMVVMGDDVAFKGRTFVSPKDFRELVIPLYKKICQKIPIPVIWHSDGYITPLVEGAIEAGFAAIQGLEPAAGVDLGDLKRKYGKRIVLIGNVDASTALCQNNLEAVRKEVRRCMDSAKSEGMYMLSDSNSLHAGCEKEAVFEMYRYAREIGRYS